MEELFKLLQMDVDMCKSAAVKDKHNFCFVDVYLNERKNIVFLLVSLCEEIDASLSLCAL